MATTKSDNQFSAQGKQISAEFPFNSNYIEVHGSKIHYVDEGSGRPILFHDYSYISRNRRIRYPFDIQTGKIKNHGSTFFSTNSTGGKLGFLNNMVGI